jgi:hypothetical protein
MRALDIRSRAKIRTPTGKSRKSGGVKSRTTRQPLGLPIVNDGRTGSNRGNEVQSVLQHLHEGDGRKFKRRRKHDMW